MGATLSSFKRSVRPGDRLLCTEQTYRPALVGTERTIIRSGSSVVECEVNGERHRMEWPKASDVLTVTGASIRYRFRGDQTITLERVEF